MYIIAAILGILFWGFILVKTFKSNNAICHFIQRLVIGGICFAIITIGPTLYWRLING